MENHLIEKQIEEYLTCVYETRQFSGDKERRKAKLEDYCITKIDDKFPLSSISFPAITKIHTTGSRAEKLWTSKSDKDMIYEIGPGLVYPKKPTNESKQLWIPGAPCRFFLEEAEHIGHYRIVDSNGGYIYPQDLQMKLAPTLQYLNNSSRGSKYDPSQAKTEASAKLSDNKDHVIGLKLDEWPASIKQQFISKLKLASFEIKKILGKTMFIIS